LQQKLGHLWHKKIMQLDANGQASERRNSGWVKQPFFISLNVADYQSVALVCQYGLKVVELALTKHHNAIIDSVQPSHLSQRYLDRRLHLERDDLSTLQPPCHADRVIPLRRTDIHNHAGLPFDRPLNVRR
jgi:hypothetical protein